jgi:type II secretory ATPase GspE/PulE/Tfp pilus assembly ATPase PilB-like protein/CheY-like chemotaxis protein
VTRHWLVRVAERAGLLGAGVPSVAAGAPAREAWAAVTRAAGISEARLAAEVARYFRLESADPGGVDPEAPLLVPESLARRHLVLPLAVRDRQLFLATCDPTDVEAERSLGFASGRTPVFRVAGPATIEAGLSRWYAGDASMEGLLDGIEEDAVRLVEERRPESISVEDAGATPVVKLTNLILREGIEARASDIHIEPGRRKGLVRFRVDGVLRQHMELPMPALNRVVSRIKILSRLDIADRLRPQDGKARVRVGTLAWDLRVSTLPAAGSEKCVIRILDSNARFTLDDLGLPGPELARFRQLLGFRDGIVLVTGPTGSGKTTTLYGALRELADGKVNIMTVEDPIEYELPAVTQTQVEVRQGVTFATALRAILRQDPDVILVGEIRDRETAVTAAQAAMTGHLVLATVHANDTVSAVARLVDLGLQFSTIGSTLRGALAQRLLRRSCPSCAEAVGDDPTPEEARLARRFGVVPSVRAVGCPECGYSGYRGRIAVQEVLVSGPRFQQGVELRKGYATLFRLAVQGGMRPMGQVAAEAVREGRTTLDEVERVLGQTLDEAEARGGGQRARILLVGEDEEARTHLGRALAEDGHDILAVSSGEAALDRLREDTAVSLVVVQRESGRPGVREVLDGIRGSVDTAALPVAVLGYDQEGEEEELLERGADLVLGSGVAQRRVRLRIRALLRRAAL